MNSSILVNAPSELKSIFTAQDRFELIFSHPIFFTGGATDFFNDLCAKKRQEGISYLVVSYHLTEKREAVWLFTAWKNTGEVQRFMSRDLVSFLNFYLPCIERVVVNNFNGLCFFSGRSFYEVSLYREIVSILLQVKQACHCEMVYYFHDFFTICPYLFLVDDKMEYCHGGHDEEHCRKCLKNPHPWALSADPDLDIVQWRQCSMEFLNACTKLVLFSLAAANLVETLLPGAISLHPEKLSLMGQGIESSGCFPVKPSQHEKMVIGVIGTIHEHKGLRQVLALRQYILERRKDARIVVIGQLSTDDTPKSVEAMTVTGRYERNDLPKLIQQYGVNVIFFSSIWPETYSRVVSEIQAMDLPVALYPLGAPAERMRFYNKAGFIPDFSTEATFNTLEKLFDTWIRRKKE